MHGDVRGRGIIQIPLLLDILCVKLYILHGFVTLCLTERTILFYTQFTEQH